MMQDGALHELADPGFAVVPGPFSAADLPIALAAVDQAVAGASPDEVKTGSTSVRVEGVLDRAPPLAAIFMHEPLLHLARDLIGGPFRLSSFHLRTVPPGAAAQALHQDVAPGGDGWPLVGFIFMVDAFSPENGATRFVPESARLESLASGLLQKHPSEEQACGSAGSMILFNGSVWHGFGANLTSQARRAIYGALIPCGAVPARDYEKTLPRAVWSQLPELARGILAGTASTSPG